MIRIKNEGLIKNLIKKDYNIPLNLVEEVDFIITDLEIKTEEEWEKVEKYLDWYTKKTQRFEDWWKPEQSLETYHRYLAKFKDVEGRESFPKKDMWYLLDAMSIIESNAKDELKQIIIKRTNEQYEKMGLYWDKEE